MSRRNPVWGATLAQRVARHGPKRGADYDRWLTDGPRIECEGDGAECGRTEREHMDTFLEVKGRTLCPDCAARSGEHE